jgi:hypothetical protein
MQDREKTTRIKSSGEEIWVHHFTPTSKQTAMQQWKHPGLPKKQYNVTLSSGKAWPLSSWTQLVCCWWNLWNMESQLTGCAKHCRAQEKPSEANILLFHIKV